MRHDPDAIVPHGFKHCHDCHQNKPEREFTGNLCYKCVKPKRDEKYFRHQLKERYENLQALFRKS